ncbi:MAG: hypothetical protein EOP93_18075 [Lysobacteraceae bacterium]|nr:MAG: hypothetical protein EOP93_18075 [Xanthomonadaceae bacterium]
MSLRARAHGRTGAARRHGQQRARQRHQRAAGRCRPPARPGQRDARPGRRVGRPGAGRDGRCDGGGGPGAGDGEQRGAAGPVHREGCCTAGAAGRA